MTHKQFVFGQEGELKPQEEKPKVEVKPIEIKSLMDKKDFDIKDVQKLTESQLVSMCFSRKNGTCIFLASDPTKCNGICWNYSTFDQRIIKAMTKRRTGGKSYVHILDLVPILPMFRRGQKYTDKATIQYQDSLLSKMKDSWYPNTETEEVKISP